MKTTVSAIVLSLLATSAIAQDIRITAEHYKFSPNSITGVYVCTPTHVENNQCSDVDDEYYMNLSRISLGAYEIGIIQFNDFDAVAFRGPFSFGSADKLIQVLSETGITTLALASIGGIPDEAFKIADWIKENNIQTWIPAQRGCLSACSYVFLNGNDPILDGVLGLHQYRYNVFDTFQYRTLDRIRNQVQDQTRMLGEIHLRHAQLFAENNWDFSVLNHMHQFDGDFVIITELDQLDTAMSFEPFTSEGIGAVLAEQEPKVYGFVNFEVKFSTF